MKKLGLLIVWIAGPPVGLWLGFYFWGIEFWELFTSLPFSRLAVGFIFIGMGFNLSKMAWEEAFGKKRRP